jgi:hypothetical protein
VKPTAPGVGRSALSSEWGGKISVVVQPVAESWPPVSVIFLPDLHYKRIARISPKPFVMSARVICHIGRDRHYLYPDRFSLN